MDVPQSQLRSSNKKRSISPGVEEPRVSYSAGGVAQRKATERPQRHADLGSSSTFHRGSLERLSPSVLEGRKYLHQILIGFHRPWFVRTKDGEASACRLALCGTSLTLSCPGIWANFMDLYTTGCTVDLGMQKAQHLSSDAEGTPRFLWASPDTVCLPGCSSMSPETPQDRAMQTQDQVNLILATRTDPWAPKQPLALTI